MFAVVRGLDDGNVGLPAAAGRDWGRWYLAPAIAFLAWVGISPASSFAADADSAALDLADQTKDVAEKSSDWHIYVEGALREARRQGPGLALHGQRLSLDVRFDGSIAPGWRAVFADRLDSVRGGGPPPAGA